MFKQSLFLCYIYLWTEYLLCLQFTCVCSDTASSDIMTFFSLYKVRLLFMGPLSVFPFDSCPLSSSSGVHLVLSHVQGFHVFAL